MTGKAAPCHSKSFIIQSLPFQSLILPAFSFMQSLSLQVPLNLQHFFYDGQVVFSAVFQAMGEKG